MKNEEIARFAGRVNEAMNTMKQSGERFGEGVIATLDRRNELLMELLRPNAKVLDCVAKVAEAVSLTVSTAADMAEDCAGIMSDVVDMVRERRNEEGRPTIEDVATTFTKVMAPPPKPSRKNRRVTVKKKADGAADAATQAN